MSNNIKCTLIISFIIIIGLIGYQWHIKDIESNVREAVYKKESEIIQLKKQAKNDSIKGSRLKIISDSIFSIANKAQSDTIIIYKNYETKINNVKRMSANDIIRYLSKRLINSDSI